MSGIGKRHEIEFHATNFPIRKCKILIRKFDFPGCRSPNSNAIAPDRGFFPGSSTAGTKGRIVVNLATA
jgi:hypothetical protein